MSRCCWFQLVVNEELFQSVDSSEFWATAEPWLGSCSRYQLSQNQICFGSDEWKLIDIFWKRHLFVTNYFSGRKLNPAYLERSSKCLQERREQPETRVWLLDCGGTWWNRPASTKSHWNQSAFKDVQSFQPCGRRSCVLFFHSLPSCLLWNSHSFSFSLVISGCIVFRYRMCVRGLREQQNMMFFSSMTEKNVY